MMINNHDGYKVCWSSRLRPSSHYCSEFNVTFDDNCVVKKAKW